MTLTCYAWLLHIGGKDSRVAKPQGSAGPVGGVSPGLDQDEGKPLQGPEPLMGVQHLDQVEQGDLAPGDEAVKPWED